MNWLPNLVFLFASIWILTGGLGEWIFRSFGNPRASSMSNVWGIGAIVVTCLLAVLQIWNDRRRFQVVGTWLVATGTIMAISAYLIPDQAIRHAGAIWSFSIVTALSGLVWARRESFFKFANRLNAPGLTRLERQMDSQLPVLALIWTLVVVVWAIGASLFMEPRTARIMMAMSPFGIAIGLGCLSNQNRRRWLQSATIMLFTLGCILISWGDLSNPSDRNQIQSLLVRALVVLAAAMAIYGGLVTRWVRENDRWLRTFREMAMAHMLWRFGLLHRSPNN